MMSQNITIQRKISIGNFLYTLFKSGQTSFNQALSLHRESVNRTFIVRKWQIHMQMIYGKPTNKHEHL